MNKSRLISCLAVLLVALGALPAFGTITIDSSPATVFQQQVNNPCVIGDSSCKEPAGMIYTSYSGTPPDTNNVYEAYSPSYTYTQLFGFLHNVASFKIGIDDNYAGNSTDPANFEILKELTVWVCTPTVGHLCGTFGANHFDPPGGTTHVDGDTELGTNNYVQLDTTSGETALQAHNGNGYSDALSSMIDISALTTSSFVFEAIVGNDTDGMEEFFLIPAGSAPIPEPASIILFGTVLLAFGVAFRKRLPS
jgi:hypothetical protein